MTTPDATCPRCGGRLEATTGLCAACAAARLLVGTPPRASGDAEPEIPGWRITGLLGAGGMGRVYSAESGDGTQRAAIKVLDLRWSRDPLMAARFEKEAALLRQLEHANIVRLLDVTETDDERLCLVMELVPGCDLGRLLRTERLAPGRAMAIFESVCLAVEHAHAQGFIHRDIKPSNILVGADGAVKLADFGLAKELSDTDVSVIGGLTATTDQFGTAYYLAPERMTGRAPASAATDVYALGVLLYHLLTGRMPVGRYTPASKLAPVPPELDRIVARALDAEPARRTADAATLRAEAMRAWDDFRSGAVATRRIARIVAVVLLPAVAGAGVWWWKKRTQAVTAGPAISASTAGIPPAKTAPAHPMLPLREGQPWTNSLGMEFVPLPGTRLLVSKYETRRREYRVYFEKSGPLPGDKGQPLYESGSLKAAHVWPEPIWAVTDEHPACYVGYHDARHFCFWLTKIERAAGHLPAAWEYRLPTRDEWWVLCGGRDAAVRVGNLAGPEVIGPGWPVTNKTVTRRDDFRRTAPVGSFPIEPFGLYDISGNVSEWTSTDYRAPDGRDTTRPLLCGPSWLNGNRSAEEFSVLPANVIGERIANAGFRVVIAPVVE